MTATQMPPKNFLLLAALGIGAYWFLTRKASATTLGNTNNSASKTFFVSPASASLQTPGQSATQAQGNLISAALNSIFNQAISRPAGYVPTYTPDSSGEAAAATYYANNPDAFVANPPSLYQQQAWLAAGAAEGNTGDY